MRMPILSFVCFVLLSCGGRDQQPDEQFVLNNFDTTTVPVTFFPVGIFLSGQFSDIEKSYINPRLVKKLNGRNDTSWMKKEQLDSLYKEVCQPVIDSIGYSSFFTETKFFDQGMNAYTFTYEPKGPLPDSIPWRSWTVYIDAETNAVKRIYLVKKIGPDRVRQMTWLPDNGYKAVTIVNASATEDDINISWNYDN